MATFKITTDFLFGTLFLIIGWCYVIVFWLVAIINIQNVDLNYSEETKAKAIAFGIISLAVAIAYTSIYLYALKEKINRTKNL
jgi:TRAP-type C4-dicarboxylate transport system permease small subunit